MILSLLSIAMFAASMPTAAQAESTKVAVITAHPCSVASTDRHQAGMISVQNGRLLINGKLESRDFSLMVDSFGYLFFYIPARGLFIISDASFEGAAECGAFKDDTLSFQVGDIDVRMESSSTILKDGNSRAWVKFDPDFKLEMQAVVIGYGDKATDPYNWRACPKDK